MGSVFLLELFAYPSQLLWALQLDKSLQEGWEWSRSSCEDRKDAKDSSTVHEQGETGLPKSAWAYAPAEKQPWYKLSLQKCDLLVMNKSSKTGLK